MNMVNRKKLLLLTLVIASVLALAAPVFAEGEEVEQEPVRDMAEAVRTAGLAMAAAITLLGAAFATAKVQAAVGAGGTGALAEKPEIFASILLLFAIPETMVLLGFVLAFMMTRM